MLLQQVAQAAAEGAHAGAHPLNGSIAEYVGWLPLLPLIGFIINGLLSLTPAYHAGPADPSAHGHDDPHAPAAAAAHDSAAEQDLPGHHDHGDDHHAVARHRHAGIVSIVGPLVLGLSFVLALMMFFAMRGAGEMHEPFVKSFFPWIQAGEFSVSARLQLDQLSMVMVLVITGVGTLIHIFSVGYMQDDPGYPRYFAYLNLFVFFMLILVLGANYPMMFIGWEGVGLCSYLLIGFWFSEKANADAGKKAFIVNRIGDFGFLVAMFLLYANLRTLDFVGVAQSAGALQFGGAVVTAICLFMFLGAAGKSAQIPLYVWLPDAMAGPTPVSALIHAATMVTAGVYLVARSAVLFAMSPVASLTVALIGALTAIFAATIGLKQWDIKKVLAYSTVSQLGYMFIGVGVGAYTAGVFHLVTHAFFKALLFLGSGSVIFAMHRAYHATHSHEDAQDMRNMGGLGAYMPITKILMWIATLAIAGFPFLSGFYSKDEILTSVFARTHDSTLASASWLGIPGNWLLYAIYAIGLISAFITAVYMTRMMIYTFHGPNRTGDVERKHLAEAPWVMTGPLVVLGVLSLFGGLLNLPEIAPFNLGGLVGAQGLHHWLEPVVERPALLVTNGQAAHVPHATEYVLILVAIAAGIAGIVLAWVRLKRGERLLPKSQSPQEVGFQRTLLNKYWVDEAYDRWIVRPTYGLSRNVLWRGVDVGIIDALVNAAARVSRGVGGIGSSLQSGQTGTYAWVLLVGVLAVLGAFTFRS
jgi:NADH-quinone oxidoreductase subunit L